MQEVLEQTAESLIFSSAAAAKVKSLIEDEGNADLKLRVFVSGGGCSGFQYGFTFDENVTEGDTIVETEGVKLLIDPMSVQYLFGAEIDYTEGLEGAQFVIRNPNAMYLVVAEWLKLTEKVNLRKFKVDQIYVLRKQKNTDREFRYLPDYQKNPVYADVVVHLYNRVRDHLTSDWESGIQTGLERGYLI